MFVNVLDVDTDWLKEQAEHLAEIGAYVLGLVVVFEANKIMVGTTTEGRFQATAEYEDEKGHSKIINRRGRTAAEALRKCSKALHKQGVRLV